MSKLLDPSQKVVALKVTFHDFKHHYNQRPFSLTVHSQTAFCPVRILLDYLALRGNRPGALFITLDGAPVTRSAFTDQLALAIQLCGLDPSRYKGHSFRIGAASHAAERGMTSSLECSICLGWGSITDYIMMLLAFMLPSPLLGQLCM